MRAYPRNSPEAAARVVALVVVADGHVCRSELDVLNQLDIARELGLHPDALPQIVRTLCEDLLLGGDASGSLLAGIDERGLAALMTEVDDPALQHKVMRLAVAVAAADRHFADGEAVVLDAARRHWRLAEQEATRAPIADPRPA